MHKKFLALDPFQFPKTNLCVLILLLVAWPSESAGAARWAWPVANRVMTGEFNPPAKPWLSGHRGLDLAARAGDSVMAAGSGVVTFSGQLAERGVVVISHGSIRTTYEPVKATVSVGEYVQVTDTIGPLQAGASHCSRNKQVTCLHWGLRQGEKYLNPIWLLNPRVRLKPIPRVRLSPRMRLIENCFQPIHRDMGIQLCS